MNANLARTFLLTLPHVVETLQWGETLVFWVGDKAVGGRIFALLALDAGAGLDAGARPVASFSAGPEDYPELLEREGLLPAPYMARIHWVAAARWSALATTEWQHRLSSAHALTLAKLPPRTRAALLLPAAQLRRLIAQRRRLLQKKVAAKRPNR